MKRCPITYDIINDNEDYSKRGLKLLSPQLGTLHPLELSAIEQRNEAINRVGKMSIQGVQKKLSAQLKIKNECFEIVDQFGHYILKPQSDMFPELPENEGLTMTLASIIGLEVPVHGLVYSKDKSMTYFIKRFDRLGHNKKLALEDFSQLIGKDRYSKYSSSMEKIVEAIGDFCTFPKIEFLKLLKLTLFNFIIGNEDMHLKNFSLITKNEKIYLSPCYDLLNSSIAIKNAKEELALPLNGKKNNLAKKDFLVYFACDKLKLTETVITNVKTEIQTAVPYWKNLIQNSFLSNEMKMRYLKLLTERLDRLEF